MNLGMAVCICIKFNLFMRPPCFYFKILGIGESFMRLRFRTFSWHTKLHSYFLIDLSIRRNFEILIARKIWGPVKHFKWWIIIDWNPFYKCIRRKTSKLGKSCVWFFFLFLMSWLFCWFTILIQKDTFIIMK